MLTSVISVLFNIFVNSAVYVVTSGALRCTKLKTVCVLQIELKSAHLTHNSVNTDCLDTSSCRSLFVTTN